MGKNHGRIIKDFNNGVPNRNMGVSHLRIVSNGTEGVIKIVAVT